MPESARAIVVNDGQILVMKRNKYGQEFYTLVGGRVEADETPEAAVIREVLEETSINVSSPRIVAVQLGGSFGKQYIYACHYISGKPAVSPDSEEARDNAEGRNLYQPLWVPVGSLSQLQFLPKELQQHIVQWLADGFPAQPITLTIKD